MKFVEIVKCQLELNKYCDKKHKMAGQFKKVMVG
jgi:hypothetical protein